MMQTVELPLWLVLMGAVALCIMVLQRALIPSVRWFFRRRMEKVVARLNERLERPIQPFKLARRTDTIQRLIYDPKVAEAVAEHARENRVREDVAFEEAKDYAYEIVPSFSASAYFGVATRLSKWLSTRLYQVRLEHYDEAALSAIDETATIIFVMNHRSNMDYVLVTYLAADRSALSYAVGEWARVWPLTPLIRAMGAYFIRRRSRNPLYRRVLARYVQIATAAGVNQAVFPEGGLSLNGRIAQPRLGLLSYIVSDFDPGGPDVVFVPVAINYDRVIEDRLLIEAEKTGVRKFRGTIPSAIAFVSRYVWRRVRRKAQRFGIAAVSFGLPLSLKDMMSETDKEPTAAVGREIMARIAAVMPVVPVTLLAAVLDELDGPVTRDRLLVLLEGEVSRLREKGVSVRLVGDEVSATLNHALHHMSARNLITETPEGIAVTHGKEDIIRFYAASIAHFGDAGAAKEHQNLEDFESAET